MAAHQARALLCIGRSLFESSIRYQVEFIICDAKQFTGLEECQARDEAKLDFHLNMSVAAVRLGRLVSRRLSLSLTSYVREAYNAFLVGRLLLELCLQADFGISRVGGSPHEM